MDDVKQHGRLITPVPPELQATRGWRVFLDGLLVDPVSHVVITHPDYGTLSYGMTPHGYDGWSFLESEGGGVVVLPHVNLDGHLFVALVEQDRPNQGGRVVNTVRGFAGRGEDPGAAARRELLEETGVVFEQARLYPLTGAPGNPNNAFFETPRADDGIRFFGLRLEPHEVTSDAEDLRFRSIPDASVEARGERESERITRTVFVPWWEAACVGDMITNAAIARLLASERTG